MKNNNFEHIKINNHIGKWYEIDNTIYKNIEYHLMESEIYGDEACCLIIDNNYNVIVEDVYNGFLDLYEALDEG